MRYYSKYGRTSRIIFASVLAVGCVAFVGYQGYKEHKFKDELIQKLNMTYFDMTDEEYVEEMKNTPSDIKGMSKYDKIEMGLMVSDDSDSDYDGLSDKDEIEKYGSDPLKASSADDLYTDGYKVAHKMNLNKSYDYDKNIKFINNECSEVELTADDALDMSAVVRDVTDTVDTASLNLQVIYKAYKLYNYSGTLSLRTNLILPSDISAKNVEVRVFKGSFIDTNFGELKKAKVSTEDTTLTPDYEFEFGETYYIFITNKVTLNSTFTSLMGGKIDDGTKESGVGLFITFPLIGNFSHFEKGTDYLYSEMSDTDSTYAFRDKFIKMLNKIVFDRYDDDIVTLNNENLKVTSKGNILMRYNLLKKFFEPFELKNGKQHWWQIFLLYTLYEYDEDGVKEIEYEDSDDSINEQGFGKNGDKEDKVKFKKYHTDFDMYVDEFCFQNFASEFAEGNCAGISHFTTYLYNKKSFSSKGKYDGISWNLKKDKENKTLMDPGIYDYKNIHFIDDKLDPETDCLDRDKLSSGEYEFVKMIGALQKEDNDKIDIAPYIKTNGELDDYSLLEKTMKYIDKNKIVEAGVWLNSGGGHALIFYDYFWTDDESITFRVYDCNLPQNDREKAFLTERNGAVYLRCNIVTQPNGKKQFEYLYYPVDVNKGYLAASSGYIMDKSFLVINDENLKVFN